MLIGIVAVNTNGAIGEDGKLPWHYSADMKFFKETTTGNAVVVGRNTWRSLKIRSCKLLKGLEAAIGIEPMNKGFADLCLTTWLRRPEKDEG